ncbi:hypothetical protein CRYUN_Cryun32bG0084700 [Craigia yunnanensis]
MKICSESLLIFFVCSVLWATRGLAIHAPGGGSEYYQSDPFTCKRYPDFPNATLPLSPPRFPFLYLTNTSPPSAKPSTSLAKQSKSVPTEIQPCESHLQDIDACIGDILNAFLTNKPNVGSACCKAISEIRQNCVDGLIPPFISQFFGPYIKELCSVPPRHVSSF